MARLTTLFAIRYLFSRKSHSLINVISLISSLSIAIPVAALIVLFSIFGGLVELMEQLNSLFDPELKISQNDGGYFNYQTVTNRLESVAGVEVYSAYIDDEALASYNSAQGVVTLRGVDSLYQNVVDIEDMIRFGDYSLSMGDLNYGIMGAGIAYDLGVKVALSTPVTLYVPSLKRQTFLPQPPFTKDDIFPTSIFTVDAETDSRYIISSLRFAQKLFNKKGQATSVAVKVERGGSEKIVQQDIAKALGSGFKVENRAEQRATIYKIMEGEKRVIYLISMLIMVIASFTVVGSLIMLMSDKKEQILTLKQMGAGGRFIDSIFIKQGLFITLFSLFIGASIGVCLVLLQQYFGFISIDSQTLLIDAYPVVLSWKDILSVVGGVGLINIIIIFVTVKSTK